METALFLLAEHPLLLTSACSNPAQAFGRADNAAPRHCLLCLKHLSLAETSPCLFRMVMSQWKKTQVWGKSQRGSSQRHRDGSCRVKTALPNTQWNRCPACVAASEVCYDALRDTASLALQGQARLSSTEHQALTSGHSIKEEKNINPTFI